MLPIAHPGASSLFFRSNFFFAHPHDENANLVDPPVSVPSRCGRCRAPLFGLIPSVRTPPGQRCSREGSLRGAARYHLADSPCSLALLNAPPTPPLCSVVLGTSWLVFRPCIVALGGIFFVFSLPQRSNFVGIGAVV